MVRAAGYSGSLRNLQRAVMSAKAAWKHQRRVYRPWVPTPGEHLVVDWGSEGGYEIFCAVLAWAVSVRAGGDGPDAGDDAAGAGRVLRRAGRRAGGGPDGSDGLPAGGTVANVVVPHPEYVQFALRYGFQFLREADPSRRAWSRRWSATRSDLVVPALAEGGWADLSAANAAARAWCAEVNAQVHSEIAAVPAERLVTERGVLRRLPSLRPRCAVSRAGRSDRDGALRLAGTRCRASGSGRSSRCGPRRAS